MIDVRLQGKVRPLAKLVTMITGVSSVSSTLLVWSQNSHDTTINYSLVLESDKIVLLLRDILLPYAVGESYPPPFDPTES